MSISQLLIVCFGLNRTESLSIRNQDVEFDINEGERVGREGDWYLGITGGVGLK